MLPLKCARYCTLKLLKLDPPGPSDQGSAKSREFAPPGGFSRAGHLHHYPPCTAAFLNHICAIELRWRSCGHPAGLLFSATHGGHKGKQQPIIGDHLGRRHRSMGQGLWGVITTCYQVVAKDTMKIRAKQNLVRFSWRLIKDLHVYVGQT